MSEKTLCRGMLFLFLSLTLPAADLQAQKVDVSLLNTVKPKPGYAAGVGLRASFVAPQGLYMGGLITYHQGIKNALIGTAIDSTVSRFTDRFEAFRLGGELGYYVREQWLVIGFYLNMGVALHKRRRGVERIAPGGETEHDPFFDTRLHRVPYLAPGVTLLLSPAEQVAIGPDLKWFINEIDRPLLLAIVVKFEL